MIDYRRDPDAKVPECSACDARLDDAGTCQYCTPSFECEWCKETIDDDDKAANVHEQMGMDLAICTWCAEDSGHYTPGLRYD